MGLLPHARPCWACAPDESNPRAFSLQTDALSTEPGQPGRGIGDLTCPEMESPSLLPSPGNRASAAPSLPRSLRERVPVHVGVWQLWPAPSRPVPRFLFRPLRGPPVGPHTFLSFFPRLLFVTCFCHSPVPGHLWFPFTPTLPYTILLPPKSLASSSSGLPAQGGQSCRLCQLF